MVSMRSGKPVIMCSTASLRIIPNVVFKTVTSAGPTDDVPLSSLQWRLPSASSFHASLLQAMDSVIVKLFEQRSEFNSC